MAEMFSSTDGAAYTELLLASEKVDGLLEGRDIWDKKEGKSKANVIGGTDDSELAESERKTEDY